MSSNKTQDIHISDFDYPLPEERIAKFPLARRDASKLLLYRRDGKGGGEIGESVFHNLPDYLPEGSLLVFNNTRVIRARLLFQKETGARIEIFCLEPLEPRDYALVFQTTSRCVWSCMVGNLRKWKGGLLEKEVEVKGRKVTLCAERLADKGDVHRIAFSWNAPDCCFADLLEQAGILPIPPYLHRETQASDLETYQTVYSRIKGSVAAPTAGLHFTPEVLDELDKRGFLRKELTLHVGAGTFKPVQSETLEGHEMHTEFISVNRSIIEHIRSKQKHIVAVGTTSVRTLESLYYIGAILGGQPEASPEELIVGQWFPYEETHNLLSVDAALKNILDYLDRRGQDKLITATQILIAPGYRFKLVNGLITNFHQPHSTLLLLISAFVDGDWRRIYDYALAHDFRFLSYGDSSLLL
ncbi:MAG: S-adenosylmethionine:tRNA ribosyltransferase-isomerase [Tannerella sp.]|jgi:S-adenosylmethionine:tRNA ribosyltransferase-isomerase|nr:S-adenosylmethionine:tRNA ribosyltransferase-isomerase [Tannerella sp.]